MRKIVHIDMDAFYASVEQRDRPELRGKPVVVAWRGPRAVVCAASYEARRFGVRSAMPALRAQRQCPQAVFVAPDFTRYREVSRQIRAIFLRHTALVEPLSLDEAYLDVTHNTYALASATAVAERIREEIRTATALTASAGVAPNKFLAKIASGWRKPDGLFVIRPRDVEAFLQPLAVGRLPGVGRTTEAALHALGIETVADLRGHDLKELETRFGRFGQRLFSLARGIDDQPVAPNRPRKSLSVEETFDRDRTLAELEPAIRDAAARVWAAARTSSRSAHTVVVKLKTSEFRTLTRSITLPGPPDSCAALTAAACALLARVALPATTRYRLAGVGLANFHDAADDTLQPQLFDELTTPAAPGAADAGR